MFHWKPFQFFNAELVKDAATGEANEELKKIELSCCTSGRGSIILGDLIGNIHIVERDLKVSFAFQAYSGVVKFVAVLKGRALLVTVGEEGEEALVPALKIWDLAKIESDGFPELLRVIKLPKNVSATSMAVSSTLTHVAVGLVNGSILLYTGDVLRERNTTSRSIDHEKNNPITGLAFHEEPRRVSLFVATTDSVSCYHITRDDIKGLKLDDKGCEANCAVLTDEGEFVIGRREAIYFYNTGGFGPCMAFESDRRLVGWFRHYAISVDQSPNNVKFYSITLYEPKNKFTAYNGQFESVTHLVAEWGQLFVFTKDGKVHQLIEKDTQTKLDTLFKKHLYQTAIDLAHTSGYDSAAIADIYRKFGDHLYSKGDFDGAITQYCKTIGQLEPSFVIKKFLDAQRIHNLTLYLQKLHDSGQANANHTTLLLNCYTKLKNVKELDEFIRKPNLNFDVETAIKVCRQAQYFQHALDLALRASEHNWYIKILLEDLHKPEEAFKYIEKLPPSDAEETLQKYGKLLVSALPAETTALLIQIAKGSSSFLRPDHLLTCAGGWVGMILVQNESGGGGVDKASAAVGKRGTIFAQKGFKRRARPEDFVHIFVSQPSWLIKYLEFVVHQLRTLSPIIYNTLLELYLRKDDHHDLPDDFSGGREAARTEKMEKAMQLLTNSDAKFDEGHALVLCQTHAFRPGILYLYEKMRLYNEIVQYYMEMREYQQIIAACRKHGDKDPNLWVKALTYFANLTPIDAVKQEMAEVLSSIERDNILPPLQVIQILAQSDTATLGLVKDFIASNLSREQRHIDEDQKLIRQYRDDTAKAQDEIKDLRTGAVIFQQMKCSICSGNLDPPAVHFLCMHSFHLKCLGENENECPVCAPDVRNFENLQRTLQEKAQQHDEFFRQLEGSTDGFSIVAKYFGRGIFTPAPRQARTLAGPGGAAFAVEELKGHGPIRLD